MTLNIIFFVISCPYFKQVDLVDRHLAYSARGIYFLLIILEANSERVTKGSKPNADYPITWTITCDYSLTEPDSFDIEESFTFRLTPFLHPLLIRL
jgi:hypothetical protein